MAANAGGCCKHVPLVRTRGRAGVGPLRVGAGPSLLPHSGRGGRQTYREVHLRSLRLRGFKSFPEPVELQFEPGVSIVVGPNGSGKSNVADAIVWAAGSLSPSRLRAEKPDDVLFTGGSSAPPASSCEVELVFDNADGAGPLPFSELSVARRLHRDGEGQYLINRSTVRRLDVLEVLAEAGPRQRDARDHLAGPG